MVWTLRPDVGFGEWTFFVLLRGREPHLQYGSSRSKYWVMGSLSEIYLVTKCNSGSHKGAQSPILVGPLRCWIGSCCLSSLSLLQIQQFWKGDCRYASTFVVRGGALHAPMAGIWLRERRDMQYGSSRSKCWVMGSLSEICQPASKRRCWWPVQCTNWLDDHDHVRPTRRGLPLLV